MLVTLAATGCSHSQQTGRWAVRSISADGLVLHLGVDVSCNAQVAGSHVSEHQDRVSIEIDTRNAGGSCSAVLTVHDLGVRLRAPLGVRWVEGACNGGCPTEPDRAPLRCTIATPPFRFGFLPSGWSTARSGTLDTSAAYQSPAGDATIELSHNRSDNATRKRTSGEVFALGKMVPLDTFDGGYAVTLHLPGKGPACGQWLLIGRGVTQSTFTTIAQQLFPR